MLSSRISTLKSVTVVDFNISDIDLENHGLFFTQVLEKATTRQVILDLSHLNQCSSDDVRRINGLTQMFQLNGLESSICGIQPEMAAVLAGLSVNFAAPTYFNIETAVHALTNQH